MATLSVDTPGPTAPRKLELPDYEYYQFQYIGPGLMRIVVAADDAEVDGSLEEWYKKAFIVKPRIPFYLAHDDTEAMYLWREGPGEGGHVTLRKLTEATNNTQPPIS